jgi:hypothetical protein
VVTGGNYNLRWAVHINVSYIKTKFLAFHGRLHLHPSYSTIGGVEERARLPARPYIVIVACVAQQWMIRVQSVLPALTAVQ